MLEFDWKRIVATEADIKTEAEFLIVAGLTSIAAVAVGGIILLCTAVDGITSAVQGVRDGLDALESLNAER
jgi:hypothetical protein